MSNFVKMEKVVLDPKNYPLIKTDKDEEFYLNRLLELIQVYKNYLLRTSEHDTDDDGGNEWRIQEANGPDFDEHDGAGTLTAEANPNRKDWYDDPKYEKFIYIHGSKHIFDKIIYLEKNNIDIYKKIEINIVDGDKIIDTYNLPIYKAILIEAFYVIITTQMSDNIKIDLDIHTYQQLKNPEVFKIILMFVDYHFIYSSQPTKDAVPDYYIPDELINDVVSLSKEFGT